MISLGSMLKQLRGLVDTKDINGWENGFLKSVLERSENGTRTSTLSASQAEKVQQIWTKHFAA